MEVKEKYNSKVACCYLTYNHPEVVDQVLEQICEDYGRHKIDIYIYDSSDNDETKKITEKYQEKDLCNLYYVDVKFIKSGDEKYLYVIKGEGLNRHYDYIWPTKDRCFFRGKALEDICESIDKGYDIVFAVNENDRCQLFTPKIKDEYTDAQEFFHHYGQLTTNWEAMIRKTETMLDPVNWDEYERVYSLGGNNNFNQPISVFARLSELEQVSIRVIHHEPADKLYSSLVGSMWNDVVFKVWIDRWIPAIYSLPDIYNPYKMEIIKAETNLPVLFGSTDALMEHKKNGAFTKERFESMKSIWNMITDVPIEYAEMVLQGEEQSMFQKVADEIIGAFAKKDYVKAYYVYYQNLWLKMTLPEEHRDNFTLAFDVFRSEMDEKGYSVLFDGIDSIDGLLKKMYMLRNK